MREEINESKHKLRAKLSIRNQTEPAQPTFNCTDHDRIMSDQIWIGLLIDQNKSKHAVRLIEKLFLFRPSFRRPEWFPQSLPVVNEYTSICLTLPGDNCKFLHYYSERGFVRTKLRGMGNRSCAAAHFKSEAVSKFRNRSQYFLLMQTVVVDEWAPVAYCCVHELHSSRVVLDGEDGENAKMRKCENAKMRNWQKWSTFFLQFHPMAAD